MGINLTFSGAGFLGIYHVGVVTCLQSYGKKLLDNITYYGGCSAGAMSAVALMCDIDVEKSLLLVMEMAGKVRDNFLGPFNPTFDPVNEIRRTFLANLPANAYKLVSGKLHISMTKVSTWENYIVSEFESNKELVDALVCTSFIPFYSGVVPPTFRGEYYIDGGFSDNLPQHFDGTTITISVFSGESDICPDDGQKTHTLFDMNNVTVQFTGQNICRLIKALFPADPVALTQLCRDGFKDTLKYLNSHYPEMLTMDVDIISIPPCCGGTFVNDENSLTCWCGSEGEKSELSAIEKIIAKEKALQSLIIPVQLYEILLKAEQMVSECDFVWCLIRTCIHMSRWLMNPCHYVTIHIHDFLRDLFSLLLPKLEKEVVNKPMMRTALKLAKEAYHAYHDSAKFEWHPSLGEKRHADIMKTKRRLLIAQKSLMAFPKLLSSQSEDPMSCVSVSSCNSDTSNDSEPVHFEVGSRSCSFLSTGCDDVFEEDIDFENDNKAMHSSPSFDLVMSIGSQLLGKGGADNDYGSELNCDNDDDSEYYSDSSHCDEEQLTPFLF